VLLSLSHSEALQKGDPALLIAFLRDMHKHYPEYANFGAVDLQGNVFAGAVPLRRPVNAANMFWFQQTMKTRDFTIGGYQICRITGLEVIVFGQPVFDRTGKMRCLLFASMDLKWLNRLWEHIKPLPDSTFTITDDSGIVLLRYPLPADKWIGKNMANVPIISAMLSRESGASETDGLDAKNRLYAFTTTKTPGGRLHMAVGMSKKAALTPIYIDLAVSLLVLALIAVLGIFLARLYTNKFILKPIRELQNAAERFSSGDYSSRANLTDGENELTLRWTSLKRYLPQETGPPSLQRGCSPSAGNRSWRLEPSISMR
jgi:HAMP domain-containing protein